MELNSRALSANYFNSLTVTSVLHKCLLHSPGVPKIKKWQMRFYDQIKN